MRAIVVKELREDLRWLPIGILLVGVFVWLVTPTELGDLRGTNKDVSQSLMLTVGVAAALLAMALAALQSVFDFSDQQRGYLFHRSVSANAVLYGKVVAGATPAPAQAPAHCNYPSTSKRSCSRSDDKSHTSGEAPGSCNCESCLCNLRSGQRPAVASDRVHLARDYWVSNSEYATRFIRPLWHFVLMFRDIQYFESGRGPNCTAQRGCAEY